MSVYYQDDLVTLYHGDAREMTAWTDADVLVTDPPYGMALRSGMGGQFGDLRIVGDDDTTARDTILDLWGARPALMFGRWSVPRPPGTRMVLTWEKGNHVGMGDLSLPWKPNTEEVYVLGSGFVGHRGTSVLRHQAPVNARRQGRQHPTEKPVALMRDLLAKCPPEWVVAEPFAGSGTTLRAAADLGRRAVGVEIDEAYCEVIARRLAQGALDLFPVGGERR